MMFLVFVFISGLIIGSFLNAVIYRLEKGESVPRGRSYCPHCKHTLAWYDLIPLVSFFLLRATCRYCQKGISFQYPAVELATGLLFLLIFKVQGLGPELFYLWIITSLLIVLFVYDLKHYILPDKILFPAIVISGIFLILYTKYEILNTIYAALGAALFFFAIFALSKGRAMGFGDVKLALFMGLFLGWPNILVALFFAFSTGAILGVVLILLNKKNLKSQVPFGPFLIAGTFFALFVGDNVVDWYMSLLLV